MEAMEEPVKENFFPEFFKKRCELAHSSGQSQKTRLRFTGSTNSPQRGLSETGKKLNSQLELLAQQRKTAALEEANSLNALDQES